MAPTTRKAKSIIASSDRRKLPQLPSEIWWLVLQEHQATRDFASLFQCALVSRWLAHLALPLLYSIHELSDASTGDASVFDKGRLIRLWRSIILSSIGKSTYPYCLWIKALRLGSLEILLEDITRDQVRKNELFAPPLEAFRVERRIPTARRAPPVVLDIETIANLVGDKVTEYVKESADKEDRVVALVSLEGHRPPPSFLPVWVSRLSLLSSLTLRDGSVLGPETARAIRVHCPAFRELRCHSCYDLNQSGVDSKLAAFCAELAPNTLEVFNVISVNELGQNTFNALGQHHAESLRELGLGSLRDEAWQHLSALSACTKLEGLALEAALISSAFNWESGDNKQTFQEVVSWLRQCSDLKHLEMLNVPGGADILGAAFAPAAPSSGTGPTSPPPRLRSLKLKMVAVGSNAFYRALGAQSDLRSLSMVTQDDLLDLSSSPEHAQFVGAICRCPRLVELNLMHTQLAFEDLVQLRESLPRLEELSFDGEFVGDAALLALARMDCLKTVSINALSVFSLQGIMDFIDTLATSHEQSSGNLDTDGRLDGGNSSYGGHEGFRIDIMNQNGTEKFSEEEEQMLAWELDRRLRGRLDIQYFNDPDELHEEDFSD